METRLREDLRPRAGEEHLPRREAARGDRQGPRQGPADPHPRRAHGVPRFSPGGVALPRGPRAEGAGRCHHLHLAPALGGGEDLRPAGGLPERRDGGRARLRGPGAGREADHPPHHGSGGQGKGQEALGGEGEGDRGPRRARPGPRAARGLAGRRQAHRRELQPAQGRGPRPRRPAGTGTGGDPHDPCRLPQGVLGGDPRGRKAARRCGTRGMPSAGASR